MAAPQKLPHIETFEDTVKPRSKLIFTPEAGHHFNREAPLSCGKGIDVVFDKNTLVCQYKSIGTYRSFLAICDDEKTYCKIFRPSIFVGKTRGSKKTSAARAEKAPTERHVGFLIGNPEAAINENVKSRKPEAMLLDFFALWCPPCNDLDEMVFPTSEFKSNTKGITKIKVNVDEEESWALKEKFKIQGYPTLVYLNSKGEEIGRYSSTQSPELLVAWIEKMKRLENMPLTWAATQTNEDNVKRVVEWNFDTSNYSLVKTLTASRDEEWAKQYFLRAEAKLAEADKDHKAYSKHLAALIERYSSAINYGYWVLSLSNHDRKAAEKSLSQALQNIDSWMKRPRDAMAEGVSTQDLIFLKVDLLEAFDKKDELKKAQSEAIAYFEKELSGGTRISRGRTHLLAYFYRESGRLQEAKKLYEALVRANPQEATFYFRYAKVLRDLKEYPAALEWLEKGASHMTEGNSRMQYASLKGSILNAMGRKTEALQIVNGTLAIAKAPQWEEDSANNWLKDLKELKQAIEKEDPKKP